jgi:pimeloyl-ACP methyl ester carboxylesterase
MRRLWLCIVLGGLAAACAPRVEPEASGIGGIGWRFAPAPGAAPRGPGEAAGVIVFAHGRGGNLEDYRGLPPQPWVGRFAAAGYDVLLFDRTPASDDAERAAAWLREGLAALRARGYARVVVAGHSRGGWTALSALERPGLADVVIAVAPAAHGQGGSTTLAAQFDQLRAMVARAPPSDTRVAFVQFAGDPFVLDPDGIARLVRDRLGPRLGALLLIDRPAGLPGHAAGYTAAFADRFGACLVAFATAPVPPRAC